MAKNGRIPAFLRVVLFLFVYLFLGSVASAIQSTLLSSIVRQFRYNSNIYMIISAALSLARMVILLLLMRSFVFFSKEPVAQNVRPLAICFLVRNVVSIVASMVVSEYGNSFYTSFRRLDEGLGLLGVLVARCLLPVVFWLVIGSSFRTARQRGWKLDEGSLYVTVGVLAAVTAVAELVTSYHYSRLAFEEEWVVILLSIPEIAAIMLAQWKGVYVNSLDSARGYKPEAAESGAAGAGAPASRVKTQEVGRIRGDGLESLTRDDARDTLTGSDGMETLDREDELDKHWRRRGKQRIRSNHDDGLSRFDSHENEERVIAASSREAIRVMEHNELQMKHDNRICDDDHK